jgi:hypothetical protein
MKSVEQPWHKLSAEVVGVLRPALDEVTLEVIEAVATIPAYARPMTGPFGQGVRAGVQEALGHFLAEIEAGTGVARPDVYRALGRGEMRSGRSLDSLLSAYRIGARVAWRRFAQLGVRAGLPPDTLYLLAESIFAYIDVLSSESADGYAEAQSAAAGERQLRRRRLVRLLVRDPPPDPAALAAAAADAGWELPRQAAVLVLEGPGRDRAGAELPPGTIRDVIGELLCAIVPDPEGPGRRGELERAIRAGTVRAGLGTNRDALALSVSFRHAQAALALSRDDGELVSARDRAGELLLGADAELAGALTEDRLAPLAGLTPRSRARMIETLAAWLAEQGRLGAVARRLQIHPQTARYRLSRLRELFGDALEDPDARFWLAVALRAAGEPPEPAA